MCVRKARQFLALHTNPGLFILPNAWDAASAKIYATAGFKAVGTTSAGIAATLGYPDGQVVSLEENLQTVRRIASHVDLPVSATSRPATPRHGAGAATACPSTSAVRYGLLPDVPTIDGAGRPRRRSSALRGLRGLRGTLPRRYVLFNHRRAAGEFRVSPHRTQTSLDPYPDVNTRAAEATSGLGGGHRPPPGSQS